MCAHRVVAARASPHSPTQAVYFSCRYAQPFPTQIVPLVCHPIGAQRTTFNMRSMAPPSAGRRYVACCNIQNVQHAISNTQFCIFEVAFFRRTSLQATANFGADERIASSSAAERPPSIKPALGLSWANCVRMASSLRDPRRAEQPQTQQQAMRFSAANVPPTPRNRGVVCTAHARAMDSAKATFVRCEGQRARCCGPPIADTRLLMSRPPGLLVDVPEDTPALAQAKPAVRRIDERRFGLMSFRRFGMMALRHFGHDVMATFRFDAMVVATARHDIIMQ